MPANQDHPVGSSTEGPPEHAAGSETQDGRLRARRSATRNPPGQGSRGGRPPGALPSSLRRAGIGDRAGSGARSAVKDVVRGAAKGAAGKSAEGKAFGGGLTGGVAGAVREAAHHAKWKVVAVVLFVAFFPTILLVTSVVAVGSFIGAVAASSGESSAQAVVASTGVVQTGLALYQDAVASNETPWQVMAAIAYYESGRGEPVAQTVGICPPPTGTSAAQLDAAGSAVCPAVGEDITSGSQGAVVQTQTVPKGVLAKTSLDRTSTDTADWACIRDAESGDDYRAPGGAYGISEPVWKRFGRPGTPASASEAAQNRFALKLLAANGYSFDRAWHDSCTEPAIDAAALARYDPFGLVPGKRYLQASTPVPSTTLGAAAWLANLISKGLEKVGGWTSSSQDALSDGVTLPANDVPRVQLGEFPAQHTRATLLAALATVPIRANSRQLDVNVYELAVDWSVGYSPTLVTPSQTRCAVASGSTLIIPTASGEEILDAEQLSNAATIVAAGRSLGIPTQGIYVAMDSALSESSLENLPNASVAGSATDPNVQWGPYSRQDPPNNGTSVGLFQQQDLWGTVVQRMDQPWSASAFYDTFTDWSLPTPHPSGLIGVAGWQQLTIAAAAQAVQGSADPGRYVGFVLGAEATVDYLAGTPCAAGVVTTTKGASAQGAIAIRSAERWIGTPYVWGGGDPTGPTMGLTGKGAVDQPPNLEGKPGFDCSGLVQYAYAQAGISLPRTQGHRQCRWRRRRRDGRRRRCWRLPRAGSWVAHVKP